MQTSHFPIAGSFVATTADAGAHRRAKHSLPCVTPFAMSAALAASSDIPSGEAARAIYSMRCHI